MNDWMLEEGLTAASDPEVPTRTCSLITGQRETSPDLTLYRNCSVSNWAAVASHDSDHSQLTYTVSFGADTAYEDSDRDAPSCRCHYSFGKANWTAFSAGVESHLEAAPFPGMAVGLYHRLRDAVITQSAMHIQAPHHKGGGTVL